MWQVCHVWRNSGRVVSIKLAIDMRSCFHFSTSTLLGLLLAVESGHGFVTGSYRMCACVRVSCLVVCPPSVVRVRPRGGVMRPPVYDARKLCE